MNNLLQLFVVLLALVFIARLLKLSLWGYVTLASSPFVIFYNFSFITLLVSMIFGIVTYFVVHGDNYSKKLLISFLVIVTAISLFLVGHKDYFDIGIVNVANSQRGEHQNFQSNILAKLLHNKTTVLSYYLKNLSDNLSLVSIFASGKYRDFSKYLPLGFLFPWYLFTFILSVRQSFSSYKKNISILVFLSVLLFVGYLDWSSSAPFVFGLTWLISFESVSYLDKLSTRKRYLLSAINLLYLLLFLLPVNVVWNI